MKVRMLAGLCMAMVISATAQAEGAGALDQIRQTKSITLGYRESSVPFAYLDNDQKPIGFSLDLCAKVVESMRKELNVSALDVKYLPVNSANRMPLIKNGTINIECGGTSSSVERMKEVNFSVATFVSQPRWLVKTSSGFKKPGDLSGKIVVVTQGSNSGPLVKSLVAGGLDVKVLQGKDHAESMLMLEQGRAAAFLEDDILLAAKKAEARQPADYEMLEGGYTKSYYGLMLPKDDDALKKVVDTSIKGLMASGEFVKIYDKWFTQPIPPRGTNLNVPVSEGLHERIQNPSDNPN
ncbi:amino acid ABC transporter substrate-binding protein [Pseudomonas putida]